MAEPHQLDKVSEEWPMLQCGRLAARRSKKIHIESRSLSASTVQTVVAWIKTHRKPSKALSQSNQITSVGWPLSYKFVALKLKLFNHFRNRISSSQIVTCCFQMLFVTFGCFWLLSIRKFRMLSSALRCFWLHLLSDAWSGGFIPLNGSLKITFFIEESSMEGLRWRHCTASNYQIVTNNLISYGS